MRHASCVVGGGTQMDSTFCSVGRLLNMVEMLTSPCELI